MMAWVPVRTDLVRSREVIEIARLTDRSRHEVAGILADFWGWSSHETVNGLLERLSIADLCETIGGDTAFWEAVVSVRWLLSTAAGLEIPNFERWNGSTAKSRLQKTLRQAKWRSGANANVDANVDASTSTTEQKRTRQEKVIPPKGPPRGTSDREEFPKCFETFWLTYPRKIGKALAYRKYQAAGKVLRARGLSTPEAAAKLQTACEAFAASDTGKGQFCPHPSAWLNQGRYDDDPTAWADRAPTANLRPALDLSFLDERAEP